MKIKYKEIFLILSFFLISISAFSQINSGVIKGSIGGGQMYGIIGSPIVPSTSLDYFELGSGSPIVITGVDELLNEKWEIKVYPTIITDKVNIQCSNTESRPFRIEIFDLLGNQINLDQISNRNFRDKVEINTQGIQIVGIYFVKLTSVGSNFSKTFKIIKAQNN